jgi:hypothetical protein
MPVPVPVPPIPSPLLSRKTRNAQMPIVMMKPNKMGMPAPNNLGRSLRISGYNSPNIVHTIAIKTGFFFFSV